MRPVHHRLNPSAVLTPHRDTDPQDWSTAGSGVNFATGSDNTTLMDDFGELSFNGSQITLPPGIWKIEARAFISNVSGDDESCRVAFTDSDDALINTASPQLEVPANGDLQVFWEQVVHIAHDATNFNYFIFRVKQVTDTGGSDDLRVATTSSLLLTKIGNTGEQ